MEISNKKLDLFQSLIPLFLLISLLFYNIYFYENNDWLGDYTYHFILLISSLVAFFLGLKNQIKMSDIFIKILENIKSICICNNNITTCWCTCWYMESFRCNPFNGLLWIKYYESKYFFL